jgi:hypothetical protein
MHRALETELASHISSSEKLPNTRIEKIRIALTALIALIHGLFLRILS